jgi:hypothetical protein
MSLSANLPYTTNHTGFTIPLRWQQDATVLPARPREGMERNVIVIRPARSRHDGATGRGTGGRA